MTCLSTGAFIADGSELPDVYTAQDTGPLTIKRIETVDDRREPHEMVFTSDILTVIERLNKLSGTLVEC
jgi:hypothetical protein